MTIARTLAVVSIISLAACRGPKSTPEETMENWVSAHDARDADAMLKMTTPASYKKFTPEQLRAFYEEEVKGIQSYSAKRVEIVQLNPNQAQAQLSYEFVWRLRGQNPEDHPDEYDTYYLTKIDGKWYVDLADNAKVKAW